MSVAFMQVNVGDFVFYRERWRRVSQVIDEIELFHLGTENGQPIVLKRFGEIRPIVTAQELEAARQTLIKLIKRVMPRSKSLIARLAAPWPLERPLRTSYGRFGDYLDDFLEETNVENPGLADLIRQCLREGA